MDMIRFNNDYSRGAHPEILKSLILTNNDSYAGYGTDEICEECTSLIRKMIGNKKADVHYLAGGTQTNMLVISSALRSFQGVISPDTGHINVHEANAIERTGHKVMTLPAVEGKISAEQIEKEMREFIEDPLKEHITEPKMAYISYPTELGTIYSKEELRDIRKVCDKYKLYLFVDGARLSYGLVTPYADVTLKDLSLVSDAFYLGGTKCGCLFGEALVINNNEMKYGFRSYMKQVGALTAKSWLIGLQFYTLLKENLYYDIAAPAIFHALRIKKAFADKGVKFFADSPTNQQFPLLTKEQIKKLEKKYIFDVGKEVEDGIFFARFCTSWYTTDEEADELIRDIEEL